MEKNNQVANSFNRDLIRCIKQEDGKTVVKFLSPFVVNSAFLFEQTGFKPDDPNLEEKLKAAGYKMESTATEIPEFTEQKPEAKTPEYSHLIERFDPVDDGIPRRKRKRKQNIKIHHGD